MSDSTRRTNGVMDGRLVRRLLFCINHKERNNTSFISSYKTLLQITAGLFSNVIFIFLNEPTMHQIIRIN